MKLKFSQLSYDSGSIEVKNVIDPIIKLSLYLVSPTFIGCIIILIVNGSVWPIIVCFCFIFVLLIFFFYQYNHFRNKDPDRLQSEKYLLESKKLMLNAFSKNHLVLNEEESLSGLPPSEKLILLDDLADEGDK